MASVGRTAPTLDINTLNAIFAAIESLTHKIKSLDGKSRIHGMSLDHTLRKCTNHGWKIVKIKGRLDSTHSIPQKYHASYSVYSHNTSTTISSKTLHQVFNPPTPTRDTTTQTTIYPYNKNLICQPQSQFN